MRDGDEACNDFVQSVRVNADEGTSDTGRVDAGHFFPREIGPTQISTSRTPLGFSLAWVIYTSLHRMTCAHSSGLGSQRMAAQIALGNPLCYVFAVFVFLLTS